MSVFCITHNPIGALLVLLVIIYSFMYLNHMEFQHFFTPSGFSLYFKEKPWIVYTVITIIIYAVLCTTNQIIDPDIPCDDMEEAIHIHSPKNKMIQKT